MSTTRKIASAIAITTAAVGLAVVPVAGSVGASDSAISDSASSARHGIGLSRIRFECTRIFVDFDTDETTWICELVWD